MPSSATPALTVRDLAKSLPGGRVLFSHLDLEVAAGEFVAVTGESGIGKSTLLNVVAGLDTADAGEVVIGGQALGGLDEDGRTRLRRARIGFVFQAFHILPHLTLAQNVGLPLILMRRSRREALDEAGLMLERVGLGGRAGDYPSQISGGEMQRVAIARALVHRPALILADEPTGNLDPSTAERILALFAGAIRDSGAAALIVTHSDRVAAAADRALRLTAGGIAPHAG